MTLNCITDTDKTGTKLVFPIKRDGTKRVSEQEAKFVFVKHIEQDGNFFYSVEAPTEREYQFSGKTIERSGNIDVCLYENGERKHLIEFKALNQKQLSFSKDFEKLLYDKEVLDNYFIHIVENSDSGTLPNIKKKYRQAIDDANSKRAGKRSHLTIFLCVISKQEIIKYEVKGELLIKKEI
jgi:hypothetical protein